MPRGCIVEGCMTSMTSKTKQKLSFHAFPTGKRKLNWLKKVNTKRPVKSSSVICSQHFTSDCFEENYTAELLQNPYKTRLKRDAVPTIFPVNRSDSDKQKTVATRPRVIAISPPRRKTLTMSERLAKIEGRKQRMCAREQTRVLKEIHNTIDAQILKEKELRLSSPRTRSVETQTEEAYPPPCQAPCCNIDALCCLADQATIRLESENEQRQVQSTEPVSVTVGDEEGSEQTDGESESENSDVSEGSLFGDAHSSDQDSTESDISGDEGTACNEVDEHKYIVFERNLHDLFKTCNVEMCCAPVVSFCTTTQGSLLTVRTVCLDNHEYIWHSQPTVNKMAVGNLLLSASVLYTGNTYTTLSEIAGCFNLSICSERHFYRLQKKYLYPSVNQMWVGQQQLILSEFQNVDNIVVSGDGRCDSPGHAASFGTYTLMECEENLVLTTNVVKVTEVANSYQMEMEGLVRGMEDMRQAGVHITTLVTDRHPSVGKVMREKYPNTGHQFDVWHLGKGVSKKLSAAAKRKECCDLKPWIKSIINHFWWSADTCNGDATELKERWMSVLRHIVNKHTWSVNTKFHKCDHKPLGPDDQRQWLIPGSPAHKALQTIVMDKRLLKDMEQITEFYHTGNLESFHNVLLKYAPKRQAFSYEGTVARTMLAAIDNNMNVCRDQATTRNGTLRWTLQWSKGTKTYVAKPVRQPKSYAFRDELMHATLDRAQNAIEPNDYEIKVPELALQSIGKTERPKKSDAVEKHISRFH